MDDCIFCKIVAGDVDAKLLYEDDDVVAFADISPMAPVHALVVPKKHVASVEEAGPEARELLAHMVHAAQQLARQLGVADSGYRLVVNTGPHAGQTIPHLHMHLLGGRPLEPRLG
jgi:histidine triad (HIT) family protein